MATDYPIWLIEAPIKHCEVLEIALEKLYRKRPCEAKAEELINASLSKSQEITICTDEKSSNTAGTVTTSLYRKYHPAMRLMLKKHESMSIDQLGNIIVTSRPEDLMPGKRSLRSTPYGTGPKNSKLEQSEINKQLAAGVIERAYYGWVATVLFLRKKDWKFWFCID